MEIGIGMDQALGLTWSEQADLARQAASLGYASAWTPAGLARDAFQICAQWSTQTRDVIPGGIATGISVVPVALWSVPALAATAGTLGDLTDGRFVLGIGAGSAFYAAVQHSLGMPVYRPLTLMRDYLSTLRPLLAGDRVEYEGEVVKLHGVQLGFRPPRVPVYLAALGPKMLQLAGERADGAALNWCTPEQIAWSRARIVEGASRAGRDPSQVRVAEYIRVSVDDEVEIARRALAKAVLNYALARPGTSKALGYRAHFARMGFDAVLSELEGKRDRGASLEELIEACPREFLLSVGYFGPATGAAPAFRRLAQGLDTAIVRVVAARPGVQAVEAVMQACRPELIG